MNDREKFTGETFSSTMAKALHSLGNKLLPIVVFSELGVRRCQESQSHTYFEKILRSAYEARELIEELRVQFHEEGGDKPVGIERPREDHNSFGVSKEHKG